MSEHCARVGAAATPSHPHWPPSCCPRGRPRGEAASIYSPSVPPQAASFLPGSAASHAPPSRPCVPGPLRPRPRGRAATVGHGAEDGHSRAGRGARRPPTGLRGSQPPCSEGAWNPLQARAAGQGVGGGRGASTKRLARWRAGRVPCLRGGEEGHSWGVGTPRGLCPWPLWSLIFGHNPAGLFIPGFWDCPPHPSASGKEPSLANNSSGSGSRDTARGRPGHAAADHLWQESAAYQAPRQKPMT